jgi:hypothetical protein
MNPALGVAAEGETDMETTSRFSTMVTRIAGPVSIEHLLKLYPTNAYLRDLCKQKLSKVSTSTRQT